MQSETLVNTMQYSLPDVETQTTVDTLRDMEGKASVNTLAEKGRRCLRKQSWQDTDRCDGHIFSSLRWLAKQWETCKLTMIETFPATLSELVSKILAITITCLKAEKPFKTDGDINAGLQAYTDVDTMNEFEAVALMHPKAYFFS